MIVKFDFKTYKFYNISEQILYLKQTFPEGSWVKPKDEFRDEPFYTKLSRKVIGYTIHNQNALLMLSDPLPNNQGQKAHPANLQLDIEKMRDHKLNQILDGEV